MSVMSRWARGEISTRQVILAANVGQDVARQSSFSFSHFFVAFPNGLNCFLKVLALPFEVCGYRIVQGVGGRLPTLHGELLELGLPLRFQRDGVHTSEARRFEHFRQCRTAPEGSSKRPQRANTVTEEEVRLLESYLYEIGPLDPRVFVAGLALGLILVLSASWLPARRAAKVDPVVALRSE